MITKELIIQITGGKNMNKIRLMMLLVLILALTIFSGCDGGNEAGDPGKSTEDSKSTEDGKESEDIKDKGNSDEDLSSQTNEVSQEAQESDSQETVETNTSIQSGEIQGGIYRVLGCRELTPEEYSPDYDGMVGILVDMVIENTRDNILNVSPMMAFEIEGSSGETYSVDTFAKNFKGNLSSIAGKGKIITGSFVFSANQDDTGFTLNITPDFMSDDLLALSFDKGVVYEEHTYQSSTEGKGLGSQLDNGELSYVVNEVTSLQDGDHLNLSILMTVLNNTDEVYDEYEIPFTLIGQDGIKCSLSYKMGNSALAGIPASASKDVEIIYEIENPEVVEYDLYLSPMGKADYWDYIHFSIQ